MFQGLPLHPLAVHFAVVLGLLAAGAVLLSVVLPPFRRWLDWGLPVLGVVGGVALQVTEQFGELLEESGAQYDTAAVHAHAEWGERAALAGLVLAGVSVLLWLTTSTTARRRWASRWPAALTRVVQVVGVLAALATIVTVTLAGHSGAAAVWAG